MKLTKAYLLTIFFLVTSYHGFCNYGKSTETTIDSLKSRLVHSENDDRFYILLELAEMTNRKDPELAASYMEQSRVLIDENEINEELFHYYLNLAAVKRSQNLFRESIALAETARQFNVPNIDPEDYNYLFRIIGYCYNRLGENDKAQLAHFKGLRLADSLSLDKNIAEFTNAIGATYMGMKDYRMSEKYLLLSINKAREIKHEPVLTLSLGNLAMTYINLEKYEEGERMMFEVINRSIENEDNEALGANYNNLAVLYHTQGKVDKAIEYVKKALVIAEELNVMFAIANRNCNLGELYTENNNYKLAEHHFNIGMETAKAMDHVEVYEYALLAKVGLYEKTGKHDKALEYYKEYSSLKDSMRNEKRIKVVAELEEKYESEKKEKEILALSNDKALAEKRERTLIQAILLLCFGIIAIGALSYFLRHNHKKNSIIQEKNLKIAADKIQLLEKRKEIIALESLIQGQENERQRIAKEMHDGLGGLLAISHSKLTNLNAPEMQSNAALAQARNLIGDAYDQVRQISHNLMPLDLKKFGLVAALTSMIQGINKQNKINIDFRTYHFDLFLNNELGLNIYRISQEAIANALKYSKARHLLIELFQHVDMISLSIEDDGIGFDLNTNNSGIGIRSMRNRAELMDGKFNIESKISVGTSIFILFPLNSHEIKPSQT